MSTPNDGGPAFPRSSWSPQADFDMTMGMTLRDYFAAKAMQMIVINDTSQRPENFREHYSEGAYQWADAMLRAREKVQP